MEAGKSGPRQSGYHPSTSSSTFAQQQHHLSSRDSTPFKPPAMATATLLNPSPAYPHTSAFSFQQPQHHHQHPGHPPPHLPRPSPSTSSTPGMIPPSDARTLSQDNEPSQRHSLPSLPSLSEVFSNPKSVSFSPKPPPVSALTSQAPPPPFSGPHSRPDALAEPRPPHPPSEDRFYRYAQRPDSGSSSIHPPGLPSYADQRELSKHSEPPRTDAGHLHPPPHHPSAASHASHGQPSQLPPGQYPLSQATASPRHTGPYPTYEPSGPPPPSEADYTRSHHDSGAVNRHIEAWGYQDCLTKIVWHARTVSNFGEAYSRIASEQQSGHPILGRLPADNEILDMLSNVDLLRQSLTNVRDLIQQSIASEKARQLGRAKHPYDGGDDDANTYVDGGSNKSYSGGEVKKRRGRAAPPGRCHSCNRIDTPEWRRGPDGARTLCNACGLHYAKLERKRQMEQRSIRPKAIEDRA
ncbi:GATA zinc finger [Microdochium nivale]|nr:GATA zinc finger [Microdochium nivale]